METTRDKLIRLHTEHVGESDIEKYADVTLVADILDALVNEIEELKSHSHNIY